MQPVLPLGGSGGAPAAFDAGPLPPVGHDAALPDAGVEDAGPPPLEPIVIDGCGTDNAAQLTAAEVAALSTATTPAGLRILYPYDGTVFPRGLGSPLFMWDVVAGSALYVHVSASLFDYKGCLPVSTPGQARIPQEVWEAAESRAAGGTDPFHVELSVLELGVAYGVVEQDLVIAPANLKGSIYYNSYSSPLALAAGAPGGAVLRIRSGGTAELFSGKTDCTGCHSLSANGERLLAQANPATATDTPGGSVWALTPTTALDPTAQRRDAIGVEFCGVFPDGSLYLESAHETATGNALYPTHTGPISAQATLYETDTGASIADTGIPPAATVPTFSPSGKLLTFNDGERLNGNTLSVMTFDVAQRKASDERTVYTDDQGRFPGWPFVLPDDHGIVFALGAMNDLSSGGATATQHGSASDLFIADIATGKAVLLARAMGYATPATTSTYLPYPVDDEHQAFYPTVSPVAAGGYFWVFFDSVRHYGNQGMQRQLWGFAIDVRESGDYTLDPSHPAFYLPGQELGTSNHRAFTALDPCKADGKACETGIDCCGGFCTDGLCKQPPPDAPRCSKTDEACKTKSDCCDANESCIAGYCGRVVLE